jgi:hypothetical protein
MHILIRFPDRSKARHYLFRSSMHGPALDSVLFHRLVLFDYFYRSFELRYLNRDKFFYDYIRDEQWYLYKSEWAYPEKIYKKVRHRP